MTFYEVARHFLLTSFVRATNGVVFALQGQLKLSNGPLNGIVSWWIFGQVNSAHWTLVVSALNFTEAVLTRGVMIPALDPAPESDL